MVAAATLFFCIATVPTAGAEPNVVDQYTEQVPTPGGEQPTNDATVAPDVAEPAGGTTGGPADDNGSPEQPAQAGATPDSGSDGPGPGDGAASADRSGDDPGTAGRSASEESSDSDGLGWLFPVLLAACLLAAVGAYLVRRHGTDRQRTT